MTKREQLHQLVEAIPEDRAADALEALRLIARAAGKTGRPGCLSSGQGVEARFLRELAADDRFALIPGLGEDLPRVAALVETYQDFPLGGADASVITIAERLGVARIATLDRRHFSVVRPRHLPRCTLLPE